MKKKRHHIWKNILIMAVVFLVASGSSIILQKTGVHEHITAIFIFAVFLTSILTDGYIYGIVSALVGTLAVNYAYTYPFYALDFRFQNIMLKCFKKINKKDTGVFAAGLLFGTAGIKLLSSKDAKKLYTNCTAAVLRAKECVLKTATTIQENAEDIYAEAQQINEDRAAAEEVVEDTAEEVTDFREETEETTEEGSEE